MENTRLDGLSLFHYGTAVFNGNATTTDAVLSYGEISGSGNLTVTHTLDWTGGQMTGTGTGRTTIGPAGTLNVTTPDWSSKLVLARDLHNSGTVQWTGNGEFALGQGATFWNEAGGVFEARGDGQLTSDGVTDSEAFINAGTFRKLTGTGGWAATSVSAPSSTSGRPARWRSKSARFSSTTCSPRRGP